MALFALFAKVKGLDDGTKGWRFEGFTREFQKVRKFIYEVEKENGPGTSKYFDLEPRLEEYLNEPALRPKGQLSEEH